MKLHWKTDAFGTWAKAGDYVVSIEDTKHPRWNLFFGDLMISYNRHGALSTAKKYAREAMLKALAEKPTTTRPGLTPLPRPETHR